MVEKIREAEDRLTSFKSLFSAVIVPLLILLVCYSPAPAAVVFSDTSFDLADYTIERLHSPGVTINTVQTLTNGNPGLGIQTLIDLPGTASGKVWSREIFMNKNFLYDIDALGAIQSIDFMLDSYVDMGLTDIDYLADAAVLFQDGNYYTHIFETPPQNAVWQTGTANDLLAEDFELVIDLLTFETDALSHPNFDSGVIQLGITSWTWNDSIDPLSFDIRGDNLYYTVNSVPVPGSLMLLGAGLIGLFGIRRRQANQQV